jgi:hypothetical protein
MTAKGPALYAASVNAVGSPGTAATIAMTAQSYAAAEKMAS